MKLEQLHIVLRRAKSGNRIAQKMIYEFYRSYLFGVANLYANSKEEAEDILLEGFFKIFKDLHNYNSKGELRSWMRKVMVNTALMHIRKYRKWDKFRTYQNESILNVAEEIDLSAKERAQSILNLIRSLPEPQRVIFTLKGIEGYSYKEISEQLGIKEVTLRSHYSRARKRLQNVLQKELE